MRQDEANLYVMGEILMIATRRKIRSIRCQSSHLRVDFEVSGTVEAVKWFEHEIRGHVPTWLHVVVQGEP